MYVGFGIFCLVEVEDIIIYNMYFEWVEVLFLIVDKIYMIKVKGGCIIVVGIIVVRVFEGVVLVNDDYGSYKCLIRLFCDYINIFIYFGYKWWVVEGLIINFYFLCFSLMMFVSVMIGRKCFLSLY